MYKRMCSECPRRRNSSLSEFKYYCEGKGYHFSSEDKFCYTKRELSKSRLFKK